MKYKKIYWIYAWLFLCLFVVMADMNVHAEDTGFYERYFQFKKFDSENGLEGTSVKCIFPSKDGFLWLGGYSGLQRYDGTEFISYSINGKNLPVNDIEQDQEGNLWIGTNGEGVFRFNGKKFKRVEIKHAGEGALAVKKIVCDSKDRLWIGTREGLYVYEKSLQVVKGLESIDVSAIAEIDDQILVIEKKGKIRLIKDDVVKELKLPQTEHTGIPRSCTKTGSGEILIGTTKEQILRLNKQFDVINIYEENGLKCINSISPISEKTYFICTDTGIGLMKDGMLQKLQIPLTDSVEEMCMDYEGNYWFVSSRQGMIQVFKNVFSDLGTYLGINKIVNSVMMQQDQLYIGCDDGLFCYHDKEIVQNQLTEMCKGERIRQIYKDQEENLWIATYYSGLMRMDPSGKVTVLDTSNSGLKTNQIRCIWQKINGDIIIGTEQGVYEVDQEYKIRPLVEQDEFNNMRILDVKEAKDGTIYATTDGHGVYLIKNGRIEKVYTKEEGILSNIVMKVVPSKQLNGIWLISGIGINFLEENGTVREIEIPGITNVLALDLLDNGEALIYATNGLLKIRESDLLKGCYDSLKHYKRHDGLPIDFTANAWNCVHDNIIYMCGTKGLTCIDLKRELNQSELKLYIHEILIDGKPVDKIGDEIYLPSDGYRLILDIRCINYIYQDYYISYYMEGVDQEATLVENSNRSEISYTNLKGGDYTYHFQIVSPDNNKSLAGITIPIHKNKKMIERAEVQLLLLIFVFLLISMLIILLVREKEKRLHMALSKKYQKEKEKMIEQLAYRDMVTGVYNRNLFEEDKKTCKIASVSAVMLFSINHIRYIEQKLGVLDTGNVLRLAVNVIQEDESTHPKIYRLSENVFCAIFSEAINLDHYVAAMKEEFSRKGKEMNLKLSLAVGAIYNNRISNETLDTLISRCEKIRLLDEKKSDAEFVEEKINLLTK